MMDINAAISALDFSREPQGLYAPIAYTLEAGGKRIRPTLCLLGSQMFGGDEAEALPAALALEVFHNFTLLHDDLMDHSNTRRSRPTVWVKWNENTAVLSGDQMMIEAYRLLSDVPAEKLPRVLKDFNQMATEICEGQQYDVDFETRDDVTLEEYLEMIRLKTSVLLANALRTGAYIAGASEQQLEALYRFGIHVGLAFQIQDDILDVYGDAATFGKPIGGDICCNKKTYMMLTALKDADAETRKELEHWLAQETFDRDEKIAAVTAIYTRLGVRQTCEQVMQQHTSEALEALEVLPQNEATDALRQLASKLLTRNL